MARMALYNRVRAVLALTLAVRTNGTANGVTIDTNLNRQNFQTGFVTAITGTITDGTHAISLQDSPDGSAWAAMDPTLIQGTTPSIGATDSNKVFELGFQRNPLRPFVRVVATTTSATTGGTVGAIVHLGEPAQTPLIRP